MTDKVIKMITEYQVLQQGDRILVGLSGGADSVALLDFLCKRQTVYGITVLACHVNHKLRGEESDRDQRFVEALCKAYEIPLFIKTVEVSTLAAQRKCSIEECAREVRYEFFAQLGEEHHCKIATAHTLSDSMETILFHLARGTGLKGLCGIPPVRGNIIRPLIYATRTEIETYIWQEGLSYVEDSTNHSDAYTRNSIRHHLIPQLYEINSNTDEAFLRMIEILRSEDAYLEQQGEAALAAITTENYCDKQAFLLLDKALQRRVLTALLKKYGIEISAQRIGFLEEALKKSKETTSLGQDIYFKITEEKFYLEKAPILQAYFEHTIEKETLTEPRVYSVFSGKILEISMENCEQIENSKKSHDCVLKNVLDYDKIYGNVLIRQKKDGDTVRPVGRGISKSLKKLFQEGGLTAYEKSKCIILEDALGIIFIEGFGCDERVKQDEFTKNTIRITIVEDSTI